MPKTPTLRLAGLPPKGDGPADWFQARQTVRRRCRRCDGARGAHEEVVAVLEYLPERDTDGLQRDAHPGWDVDGWLAWWECPSCGEAHFEVVTAQQVVRWGEALGGWERP
jgi:hypothetical protein